MNLLYDSGSPSDSPRVQSLKEAGFARTCFRCPRRRRLTGCHSPPQSPLNNRRSKATPSMGTAIAMARPARKTFWELRPPCSASPPPLTTPCIASRRRFFHDSQTSMVLPPSLTPTAAAWPSTRPARQFRSAPSAISACTPTSGPIRWWSVWVARRCSHRAYFRCGRAISTSSACRTNAGSAKPSPRSCGRPRSGWRS